MNTLTVATKRGARVRVLEAGSGAALVFLHGAGGFFPDNPFLDALAKYFNGQFDSATLERRLL